MKIRTPPLHMSIYSRFRYSTSIPRTAATIPVNHKWRAALIGVATLLLHSTASAQLSYAITDLGPGAAFGINNAGEAVGVNAEGALQAGTHAFLYSNGTVTDLGDYGQTGIYAGQGSVARAINDSGLIAGVTSLPPNPPDHPLYGSSGFVTAGNLSVASPSLQLFATYTNVYVELGGINNSGTVVGSCNGHAISFSSASGYTDLGTLGGTATWSYAYGINNAGTIVGTSQFSDATSSNHAFYYSNGVMHDLGLLTGTSYSDATSINNQGQIVGVTNNDIFLYQNVT